MPNFNSRRVLFDTNVLLDAVIDTRPQNKEARLALRRCNGGGDMGLVTAGTLKDVYYILSKPVGKMRARECVGALLERLVILPLGAEEAVNAEVSDEPDYEDALVRAAAELNEVDFILTRDVKAFRGSTVRAVSCAKYLEIAKAADEAMARLSRKDRCA